ncbi:transposase [Xinfangfangia sp. D13-10-4-6]|nr:transposase [Pseudogemmobacter hezensis]
MRNPPATASGADLAWPSPLLAVPVPGDPGAPAPLPPHLAVLCLRLAATLQHRCWPPRALAAGARDLIAAWVTDYNTARPHSALGYQTPTGFALHLTNAIARRGNSHCVQRDGRLLNPRRKA